MRNLLSLLFLWLFSSSVQGASYYVDGITGDDGNNGLSPGSAWRTLSKVNGQRFAAGDTVALRRGQSFPQMLSISQNGVSGNSITFSSYGEGSRPVVRSMSLSGSWLLVEQIIVDQNKGNADAVTIRGADNITLKQIEIRNGTKDGIDATRVSNLTLIDLHIHHLLAGSFTTQADAHGIALSDAEDVRIERVEIHHVSGDSIQADPNRSAGNISNFIEIVGSTFWTGPLLEQFNDGWLIGQIPGENALDTKVVKSGFENEPRMQIFLENVTAYGWSKGDYITNRAAFNLKEKVNVVFNGVRVYDSEIAFRIRGGRGNADVTINNGLIHNVDVAVRAEDDVENLILNHVTFGQGIGDQLKTVASGNPYIGWQWLNSIALTPAADIIAMGVIEAGSNDFRDIASDDYQLNAGSPLIDQGTPTSLDRDLAGQPRFGEPDPGAYELVPIGVPMPPVIADAEASN